MQRPNNYLPKLVKLWRRTWSMVPRSLVPWSLVPVLISDNLPRRTCLFQRRGRSCRARVLTGGEFPAPVLISENLPRRAGLPPTPGRPAAKRFDWTPGGRQLGAGSWEPAGSREASEIRMLNHWAAGLRSKLLPEGCGVATPEMCPKSTPKCGSLPYGFDAWCQGMFF